jgi:hypothetical protein
MTLTESPRLHSLHFPTDYRCCECKQVGAASAVQILSDSLSNRQQYLCPACATEKNFPPSQHWLKRLAELDQDYESNLAEVESTNARKLAIANSRRC